jgi:hypothetical protein
MKYDIFDNLLRRVSFLLPLICGKYTSLLLVVMFMKKPPMFWSRSSIVSTNSLLILKSKYNNIYFYLGPEIEQNFKNTYFFINIYMWL